MLKIKDNVDLKELEKYGFEFDDDSYCKTSKEEGIWIIDTNDREICFQTILFVSRDLSDLYDLIKNGLVEKV